jgi:hypothetical protein
LSERKINIINLKLYLFSNTYNSIVVVASAVAQGCLRRRLHLQSAVVDGLVAAAAAVGAVDVEVMEATEEAAPWNRRPVARDAVARTDRSLTGARRPRLKWKKWMIVRRIYSVVLMFDVRMRN